MNGMKVPAHWQADADLSHCTTFAVPARARWLVEVQDAEQLPGNLAAAERLDLPVLVLGGGSNILFTEDYPGLVVHLQLRGISVQQQHNKILVSAAAGENWHDFVQNCLQRGWHGLENLALIPGSAGAAPVQNIGAYGVELADVLHSVRYYDRQLQRVEVLPADQCDFAYRDSVFKHALKDRAIILECCFSLESEAAPVVNYPALQVALAGKHVTPQSIFDAVCAVRRSKLPDPAELGNAGSFFRNPVIRRSHYQQLLERWPQMPSYHTADADAVKVPAAWLIESAGWKGVRRGTVGVHAQQALVLVHDYKSAPVDILAGQKLLALAQDIAASVQAMFAVVLQPEVRIEPASAWHDSVASAREAAMSADQCLDGRP